MGMMVRVEVEGRKYEIPDMWIIGYTHHGRTYEEAIAWWDYQAQLEERDHHGD